MTFPPSTSTASDSNTAELQRILAYSDELYTRYLALIGDVGDMGPKQRITRETWDQMVTEAQAVAGNPELVSTEVRNTLLGVGALFPSADTAPLQRDLRRFASPRRAQIPPEIPAEQHDLIENIDSFFLDALEATTLTRKPLGFGAELRFNPAESHIIDKIRHPLVYMDIQFLPYLHTSNTRRIWVRTVAEMAKLMYQRALLYGEPRFIPITEADEETWEYMDFMMRQWMDLFNEKGEAIYHSLDNPKKVPPEIYAEKVRPFLNELKAKYQDMEPYIEIFNLREKEVDHTKNRTDRVGRVHDFRSLVANQVFGGFDICEEMYKGECQVDCSFLLAAKTITGLLDHATWRNFAREKNLIYHVQTRHPKFEEQLIPKKVAQALNRIFQNIITNADKYRQPGVASQLIVTLSHDDDGKYRIQFEDNGMGIPQELVNSSFGRGKFWRAREVIEKGILGDGTGSTVIRELTEALGGTLHIESRRWSKTEFGGTTITLEFGDSIFSKQKIWPTELPSAKLKEILDAEESDPENPRWNPINAAQNLQIWKRSLSSVEPEHKPWVELSISMITKRLRDDLERGALEHPDVALFDAYDPRCPDVGECHVKLENGRLALVLQRESEGNQKLRRRNNLVPPRTSTFLRFTRKPVGHLWGRR